MTFHFTIAVAHCKLTNFKQCIMQPDNSKNVIKTQYRYYNLFQFEKSAESSIKLSKYKEC